MLDADTPYPGTDLIAIPSNSVLDPDLESRITLDIHAVNYSQGVWRRFNV